MDQALKKQVKKYAVMTVIMVIMALAVVKLNNVTKTQGRLLRQEKWSVSWKTTFRKTECVWGSRL